MVIDEVFPNPTVKKVIFQIRFPNLFYIESKIGEIQEKIMEKFPESALIFRQQLLLADLPPEEGLKDLIDESRHDSFGNKIWQFRSSNNYKLNILSDSLDITSEFHKTYNNLKVENRFRDIIEFVLDKFFSIVKVPIINRIGLRYIDECPIPSKDNKTLIKYYNSAFPTKRFKIENADKMDFITTINKNGFKLRYVESLQKINEEYKLILDFDGYSNNISSKDYLNILDKLHEQISEEYEKTIKDPVYKYMRQKKE